MRSNHGTLRISGLMIGLLTYWLAVPAWCADDYAVGIYFNAILGEKCESFGAEGIKIAIEDNAFTDVSYVKSFKPEDLKDIRVLIVPCVLNYPKAWDLNEVREDQRKFVESGGGLILIQESVGWRSKKAFMDNPIFPEFGRGVAWDGKTYAPIQHTPLTVVDKDHPITRDLPAQFKLQYDSAPLKLGEKGHVLIKFPEDGMIRGQKAKFQDLSAVIVGEHGKGRVVLMGPVIGITWLPREMETPPTASMLKLLLNSVRWCAGKQ